MLKLYLIRHGETDWNAAGRIQGLSDIELNRQGELQAQRLAARLAEQDRFTALYSSPLRRAARTAELIGQHVGLRVIPDARLVERSLGELEGLTMGDIRERFPEVHRAWHEGGVRPSIPGEESRETFVGRAREFVVEVRAHHADGKVIVVTHGGTINMLLMASLNLDIDRPLPFWIDNASINIVQWGERGVRLRLLNDTCHLDHSSVPHRDSTPARAESKSAINAAEVQ